MLYVDRVGVSSTLSVCHAMMGGLRCTLAYFNAFRIVGSMFCTWAQACPSSLGSEGFVYCAYSPIVGALSNNCKVLARLIRMIALQSWVEQQQQLNGFSF